ncbi:MAG: DUF3822 family protein [Dysgonamonadaceae bacterium]|jgi:hypothetical protein|nr:DUF3822 family protein [Dysgonamonadaceae bacterium]
MEIQLPENMDLSRSGQYVLILEVHAERFSFSLYNAENEQESFDYCFSGDKLSDAFSQFQDAFFKHDFFTYPFRKILILNHTPVFTYIPNLLFEEKDKEAYIQFLFTNVSGKILHQTLSYPEMTILHSMPEKVYDFLQRSFPEASIVHYTVPFIEWCRETGLPADGNRMIIFREKDGIDVLCFSRRQLLLCNHFDCESAGDAVYYALYVYKQLKFNQLKDFVYLVKAEDELEKKLNKYIQNIVLCEDNQREIQKSAI